MWARYFRLRKKHVKRMKECDVNVRPKTFQSNRSRDFETGSGRK